MKTTSLLATFVLSVFITIASSSEILIEGEIEVEYWWSLPAQAEQEVSGTAYFLQATPTICRSIMHFDRGFISKDPDDYEFTIDYFDVSEYLRSEILINTPGTSPFLLDFTEFFCQQIVDKRFIIKYRGITIDSTSSNSSNSTVES
ncbi:16396_t:CDS:2 [Entrophospora sp. SA101]|nr:16396_t:CDS:2 [Entrophospora sp. SA101]